MIEDNHWVKKQPSIWQGIVLDAASALRTSVQTAMLNHIIQARLAINSVILNVASAVKSSNNHHQVWSLHSKTYVESKSASLWCSRVATSYCHVVIPAVVLRTRRHACLVSNPSALRKCQKAPKDWNALRMTFVLSASAQELVRNLVLDWIVATSCISTALRLRYKSNGMVLVSSLIIFHALSASKSWVRSPVHSFRLFLIRSLHSRTVSLRWLWNARSSKIYIKTLDWKSKVMRSLMIYKGSLWRNCRTICVLSAQIRTSVVWKIAMLLKMIIRISRKKNWFAENARQLLLEEELKIVRPTAKTSSNSNASFAARLLNGSAGEILISVSRVIRNNVVEIMFQESREINYLNVQVKQSAHWR